MIIGDITGDINEGDIFVKDFADKRLSTKRHGIGDIFVVTRNCNICFFFYTHIFIAQLSLFHQESKDSKIQRSTYILPVR